MMTFNKKPYNAGAAMDALQEIQEILFLTSGPDGRGFVLDPDKEWDDETLERVGDVADKYGLRPHTSVRVK